MPYFNPKIWRPIPGFPNYVCTKDGQVANSKTGRHLTPYNLGSRRRKSGLHTGTKRYDLFKEGYFGSQRVHISRLRVIELTWPDLDTSYLIEDGVEYLELTHSAPGYYISKEGEIINKRYNMRHMAVTILRDGSAKVRLTIDGIQHIFDVDKLIEEVW